MARRGGAMRRVRRRLGRGRGATRSMIKNARCDRSQAGRTCLLMQGPHFSRGAGEKEVGRRRVALRNSFLEFEELGCEVRSGCISSAGDSAHEAVSAHRVVWLLFGGDGFGGDGFGGGEVTDDSPADTAHGAFHVGPRQLSALAALFSSAAALVVEGASTSAVLGELDRSDFIGRCNRPLARSICCGDGFGRAGGDVQKTRISAISQNGCADPGLSMIPGIRVGRLKMILLVDCRIVFQFKCDRYT